MVEENKVLPEEEIRAVEESKFDFDVYYAEAWSRRQGGFSFGLANNLIRYLNRYHIYVKSVLDVCSGSGEFVSIMRNVCQDCMGVDNADGYINYVTTKFNDIDFKKVDYLYDFKLKRKFDLISFNHDTINLFTKWSEWQKFFETCYSHLVKNGILMFDFYTKKKLDGWTELIFEQGEGIDYVSDVKQNNGYCVLNETYYLKETNALVRKTGDIMVEAWFDTENILSALKQAGFKSVEVVDYELNKVEDYSNMDRIHILARR